MLAAGVRTVLVNGVVAVDNGALTGMAAGPRAAAYSRTGELPVMLGWFAHRTVEARARRRWRSGCVFALVWPQATPYGRVPGRPVRPRDPDAGRADRAGDDRGGDHRARRSRSGSGDWAGARSGCSPSPPSIAVSVGMLVATLVQPGVGAPLGTAAPHALGAPVTPYEQLIGIIPLNIVEALAKGDMLALIFVAILLGVGTVLAGEAGKPFARVLQSLSAVLLTVVGIVMEATPFGVFALIANAVAANGAAVFVNVGWLALAVVLGSLIQIVLVHSLMLRLLAQAAGAAVLPRHRRCAGRSPSRPRRARRRCRWRCGWRSKNLGIARPVYSTVLPLGASIGKDGTAMYVGLLSLFALQAFGVPLTPRVYAHGAAHRRARGVRDGAGAVGVVVHARGGALRGRRRARADRAGGRLRAAVRPAARHDAHRAERERQSDRGDHGRAVGRRAGRGGVPLEGREVRLAGIVLLLAAAQAEAQAPLTERVAAALRAQGPGTRFGLVVTDMEGREIVAIAPDERFIPASNTKLFTTAAAFATLAGIDRPDAAGGAAVRLERRGGARPTSSSKATATRACRARPIASRDCLAALADAVAARTRVVRDVIGDDTPLPRRALEPGDELEQHRRRARAPGSRR